MTCPNVRCTMRLIPRFAPLLLGLCAAGPAFAGIAPTIDVQILSTNATTEDVAVTVPLHRTTTADCPAAGPNQCLRTRISLRVVPTPIGLPDTNGGYNVTYFDETLPIDFTLTRGQAYTITSQVKFDVGKPAPGGVCNIQCTFNADIQASYTATPFPPVHVPPTWDVTFDSSDGNVMFATIRMVNFNNNCSTGDCISNEVYGQIVPCPVDAPCDGAGVFQFHFNPTFNSFPTETLHVAFQIGTTYTISGLHRAIGLRNGLHAGCEEPVCEIDDPAPDKIISPTPVATRPISWGAVKAMYRQ